MNDKLTKGQRTRARVLNAAAELFAQKGLNGTSVRAIASHAGVDPALVHHYFGTKDKLFIEVVAQAIDISSRVINAKDDDPNQWAANVIRHAEAIWTSPAAIPLKALARSGLSGNMGLFRLFIQRILIPHIAPYLPGDPEEQRLRVTLVSTQMMGLVVQRYLLETEPLASASVDELITWFAPNVQRYLTGNLNSHQDGEGASES